jgi:hypothetical protein
MPIQTVVTDMDGTILDAKKVAFPSAKDKLEILKDMYATMIAWSHTGGEYTKRKLIQAGLLDIFMKEMEVWLPKEKKWIKAMVPLCFDKPDVIIDNDPDSIFRQAAIIKVSSNEDWEKEEDVFFKGARDHVEEYIDRKGGK